ncbi:MAG: 60S ribosomal protein L31 [Thaumarchaeota archaeon]|nr:60S ribosomal protein L31 [Nitrososphaerota archaeon]
MSEEKVEPLTRTYTVPLGIAFEAPAYRRAKVAIRIIKEFTTRHMKATDVSIGKDVNEKIWARGIRHPPRRITVEMERDEDGTVSITLPKEPEPV